VSDEKLWDETPTSHRLLCRAALELARRTEVNDDEHSRFLALRIGYCYLYMDVERGAGRAKAPPGF